MEQKSGYVSEVQCRVLTIGVCDIKAEKNVVSPLTLGDFCLVFQYNVQTRGKQMVK